MGTGQEGSSLAMGRKKGVPHPPGCKHCTPETFAKIGAANKGRPSPFAGTTGRHSDEGRARISAAQQGENNSFWAGKNPSYRAAHSRVERARGKANTFTCIDNCGRQAAHWSNLTGNYGDIDDYEPRCVSCHVLFDNARRNAQ